MATPNTCNTGCEAHRFVMELIAELKDGATRRDEQYHDLRENVIILTQNMMEVQRVSTRMDTLLEELKKYDEKQDTKIDENSKFTIKAGAVIAAIAFLAALTPLISLLMSLSGG